MPPVRPIVILLILASSFLASPLSARAQDLDAERRARLKELIARQEALRARERARAADSSETGARDAAIAAQRNAALEAGFKAAGPAHRTCTCILIGQITSTSPSAKPDQALATLHVLQSFRGIDLAGTELLLTTPSNIPTGQSRLFTLRITPLEESAQLISAEEPSKDTIKAALDKDPGDKTPSPKRIFWMYRQTPPADGLVAEFYVSPDGAFSFTSQQSAVANKPAATENLSGKLSDKDLAALIAQVNAAREINGNPPAGVVTLRWLDGDTLRFKPFVDVGNPPARDLLTEISRLVRENSKPR